MIRSGFDQYYDEAVEPGKRERAYAWATAIGLQDVDGLKPSKHLLATAKRHIEGEITQEEARRIVDEYYETKDGHDLPRDTKEADRVADLHRRVGNSRMGGNVGGNMGGNLLSVLPKQQQSVCRFMLKDPSITALQIAELQKVRVNTIEKRIAVLRKKGVIVREGGTRGVWKVLWH